MKITNKIIFRGIWDTPTDTYFTGTCTLNGASSYLYDCPIEEQYDLRDLLNRGPVTIEFIECQLTAEDAIKEYSDETDEMTEWCGKEEEDE